MSKKITITIDLNKLSESLEEEKGVLTGKLSDLKDVINDLAQYDGVKCSDMDALSGTCADMESELGWWNEPDPSAEVPENPDHGPELTGDEVQAALVSLGGDVTEDDLTSHSEEEEPEVEIVSLACEAQRVVSSEPLDFDREMDDILLHERARSRKSERVRGEPDAKKRR